MAKNMKLVSNRYHEDVLNELEGIALEDGVKQSELMRRAVDQMIHIRIKDTVLLDLPSRDRKKIDMLIEAGEFETIEDFLKHAVKAHIMTVASREEKFDTIFHEHISQTEEEELASE